MGGVMDPGSDFSEFIGSLTGKGVRHLLVGGYAVGFHGRPRYTKDMDVWSGRDEGNAARMVEALEDFGFEPGTLQTA